MAPDSIPPHHILSTTPIPTTTASTLLTTYLTNSERHPHLHPDALITPSGITFASSGGPTGGVIMHNLRRIAAGLRGEYLEPEKTPEPEEEGWKGKRRDVEKMGKGSSGEGKDAGAEEGWQNMSEYEQENATNGLVIGEVGKRDTFVAQGKDVDTSIVIEDEGEDEHGLKRKEAGDGESKKDKEARKKAKKEKNKAFKRQKAEQKAGK